MAVAAFEKASAIEEELEVAVAAARSTDLIATVSHPPTKSSESNVHTNGPIEYIVMQLLKRHSITEKQTQFSTLLLSWCW